MIPRYSRPEMTVIWEPQTRFRIWFEIEAHAADAMAELGVIPKAAAGEIWDKARDATFDVERIDAIERETKHDVIAFLTHLGEIVGESARFVHQGMTSSDVLDTTLNVQLTRAADILIADIDKLLAALERRAFEHKLTPTIGRSHGIHAEPTTFGLKLAQAYAEFSRGRERLVAARELPHLVGGARRTCGDRLVAQEAPDVFGEIRRRAVAALLFLLERLGDDRLHVLRHRARREAEARGLGVADDTGGFGERLAIQLVGRALGEDLIQNHPQRVDIRARVDGADVDAARLKVEARDVDGRECSVTQCGPPASTKSWGTHDADDWNAFVE